MSRALYIVNNLIKVEKFRTLPLKKHCSYAVKIEDEVDFVGVGVLNDSVHGFELGSLPEDYGLGR